MAATKIGCGPVTWAHPLSDPRKEAITVKQLLNHTSGICPEATGAPNDGTWAYVLGHSEDPRTAQLAFDPGTACGYSTLALQHASLVCETVTGMPYDQFAIEALFKPIGCEHWWFQFFEGGERYGRHPSHAMGMPARDLARIAYCMLLGGRWRDQQIIPAWFVEETAKPTHNVQGEEMRFRMNAQVFSHGWELPARLTGQGGRRGDGIPDDARYKPGSGGQLVAFVPSLDLVISRQTGGSGAWEYEEYLRRACQAVLPAVENHGQLDNLDRPDQAHVPRAPRSLDVVREPAASGARSTGPGQTAVVRLEATAKPARGPLHIHPDNPRYFTDGTGRAVYLTGSHTWNNLVDMGRSDPPEAFDFDAYLDFLDNHGHNFIRLWAWDSVTWDTRANGQLGKDFVHHVAPLPWARTGPGLALDGKPKFDLSRFEPEYFERLRQRVEAAGKRGVYVSVMLFDGGAPGAG